MGGAVVRAKGNGKKGHINAVLFDFGGVLADEGFRKGIEAIGERYGVEGLFKIAEALIYETGYVTGNASEAQYWNALRAKTGISGSDGELREEILKRFVLRGEVLDEVKRLRSEGIVTAILSDQTNWLEELDAKTPFRRLFDFVFNSFRLKKGKRDPSIFTDALRALGIRPEEALFIDDKEENIERAAKIGMRTLLFKGAEDVKKVDALLWK